MFRCESTLSLTTESLKQLLPKGFVKANTDLSGAADLTEEDISTSITCVKGSTTARLAAMTIRAGLERKCWVAEIVRSPRQSSEGTSSYRAGSRSSPHPGCRASEAASYTGTH
mmetsp:Transcript_47564/g.154384  ORF Transcript_47564/g.154384 Transcript_47564/m.154384 type:complete len:113 (-) Transcript_47564:1-339(-)